MMVWETAFKTCRQNIALKGGSFHPAVWLLFYCWVMNCSNCLNGYERLFSLEIKAYYSNVLNVLEQTLHKV